jgi:hypothetical protein
MGAKLIKQAKFATQCGVTNGAIYLAGRRGLVHIDPETRKIDPDHPLNIAYKNNNQERTSKRQKAANLSKSIAKELSNPDGLKELLKEALQEITSEKSAKPAEAEPEKESPPASMPETPSESNTATPVPSREPRPTNPNPGNRLEDYDPETVKAALQAKGQKAALENLKIQEKQLKIAELSGELVRRDHVKEFIGIISGTISNYFLPLDFRLTSTIMDICGINDPEIKLKISEAIAKETVTGLTEVQKKADQFARSLNPALS